MRDSRRFSCGTCRGRRRGVGCLMWGSWRLPRVFNGFNDSHGKRGKNEPYLPMAATWGFYPSCRCCINARRASHIEVVVLEGKTGDDQDYRSEHISAMVARQLRQDSGESRNRTISRGMRLRNEKAG